MNVLRALEHEGLYLGDEIRAAEEVVVVAAELDLELLAFLVQSFADDLHDFLDLVNFVSLEQLLQEGSHRQLIDQVLGDVLRNLLKVLKRHRALIFLSHTASDWLLMLLISSA